MQRVCLNIQIGGSYSAVERAGNNQLIINDQTGLDTVERLNLNES